MMFCKLPVVAVLMASFALLSCTGPSATSSPAKPVKVTTQTPIAPYQNEATNLIYNLLFCDDLRLFKDNATKPYKYPYDVLLADSSSVTELQKIIDDTASDPRVRVLAYNRQVAQHHVPAKKELLAVIVEVGLEGGTDVLASFYDGTARYINYTGKMVFFELRNNDTVNQITRALFTGGNKVIEQISPWDKPRRPQPKTGDVRITFLVSDGLYFGEGPMDDLYKDVMAAPVLNEATKLMVYLTQRSSAH